MAGKALEGVKVLEYASFVTGPYCAKLLADLGAEVIKIERPGVGDEARMRGPFPKDIPHPERSGLFLYLNTNKLGITLDPKASTGRKIFLELLKQADILIEDRPPKEMENLGLTYDSLAKANPGLVMTSITPFGQTGPYRDYKAYCLNLSHGAGAGYITPVGSADFELGPIKGGGFFDDYCDGLSAASATLVALYSRQVTGKGQHIDVSKQEASIGYDRVEVGMFANDGVVAKRVRTAGGIQLLPCNDGYALIAMGEDRHWKVLVEIMGEPEWTRDERFKDRESREKNAQEMISLIGDWTKTRSKDEVYYKIGSAGIPAGALRSQGDIIERDEQLKARGLLVETEESP